MHKLNFHNRYLNTMVFLAVVLVSYVCMTSLVYAQNRINVRAGIHDRFERLVFDWKERVKYTNTTEGNRVSIQFDKPAILNTSDIGGTNLKLIKNFKFTNNNNGLYVTFNKADDTRIQAFWAGTRVAFDVQRSTKNPPAFSNNTNAEDAEKETQTGPQKPQKIDISQLSLKQTVERIRSQQRKVDNKKDTNDQFDPSNETFDFSDNTIRFPLTKETAATIFKRNDILWVAFADELTSLPPQIKGEKLEDLPKAQRIMNDGGTAFRFDVSDVNSKYIYLDRDNFDWIIQFSNEPRSRGTFIDFEADFVTRPEDPRVRADVYQENNVVLSFMDPQVGDELRMVALTEPTFFVSRLYRYPEFNLIPSIHGVVMEPYTDNLVINTKGTIIEIAGDEETLLLSNNIDRLSVLNRIQTNQNVRPRLFQIERQRIDSVGSFEKARRRIEKSISQLSGIDRSSGYLELAKLYISYGFGHEANGLLDIAFDILPDLDQNPEFIALRGVAQALAGQYEAAIDNLSSFDLTRQEEAQLWLGYVYAQMKLWKRSQSAFSRSGTTLNTYPSTLRSMIMLAKAEAAIKEGQVTTATRLLENIRLDNDYLPISQKSAFMYLKANILLQTGNEEEAQEILKRVSNGRDRLYRAKAEFDLVRRQYEKGTIEVKEAIERLEKQRFAWRGDRLEILITEQLSKYYFEANEYHEGLSLLRDATSMSNNAEDRERMTGLMSSEFEKLFVDGEADELKAIDALAVYNGFKELTPVADKGVKALRYLATRLKEVDLLDNTERILAELISFRAKGALKAEIGTELAAVQLLNKKPDNAIQSLMKTQPEDNEKISDELFQQRKILLAKAYADNKQTDKALDILRWDASIEAMQLKADINWNAGKWEDAARIIDRLIRRITVDGVQDDEKEELRSLVVRQGIAFALEGNQFQLDRLKKDYAELMTGQEDKKIFDMITQPITEGSLSDLQSLQSRINNVELFDGYLNDFEADDQ